MKSVDRQRMDSRGGNMRAKLMLGTLLAATVALAGSVSGQAQTATVNSLKKHDSNAPVDFAADRIELQDRADRAVLTGNVDITQSDMRLRAARVTIAYTSADQTQINRMDASGGVTLTTSSETARSQYAIYDLRTRLVTMIGGVTIARAGKGETKGDRLVLNLNSGQATLGGNQGGRVTGRFTPPPRQPGPSSKN
jgi:lipopolysaccharide export system protein LptA